MTASDRPAHICRHHQDCGGPDMLRRSDPLLPDHIIWIECPECGAAAEWDSDAETVVGW